MGFGGISVWQLLIILLIVIMLCGTKRLKGLGSDLGDTIKGFRNSMGTDEEKPSVEEKQSHTIDAEARKVEQQKKKKRGMFDIGFMEMLLVGLVALVVLGPERLPGAVRTAGLWIGRLKRSFSNIKAEVEREIGADEIRRQLHNERILDLEKEMQAMKQNLTAPVTSITQNSSEPTKPAPPEPTEPAQPTEPVKAVEPPPAPRPDRS